MLACSLTRARPQYRPSELCAAATHIALRLSGKPGWSPTLSKYTRYTEADLVEATKFINGLHAKAGDGAQKAAFKKYSSSRFRKSTLIHNPVQSYLLLSSFRV